MSTIKFTPVDEIPQPSANVNPGGVYVPVFEYLRANPGKPVPAPAASPAPGAPAGPQISAPAPQLAPTPAPTPAATK